MSEVKNINVDDFMPYSVLKNNGVPLAVCGIYKITAPDGKIYIGQTKNTYVRYYTHSSAIGKKTGKLVHSFSKYGFKNHKFEIVFECKKDELDKYEMFFIEKYNSDCPINGLNILKGKKCPLPESVKKNISLKNTGQKRTAEQVERIKNAVRRKPIISEEERKRRSDRLKSIVWTKEMRLKHGLSQRGKKMTDATKLKISLAKKGKKGRAITDIEKQKLRELFKGKKRPKHVCDKISATKKSRKYVVSEETRLKLSKNNIGKKHHCSPVIVLIGNEKLKFNTSKEAAEYLKISRQTMNNYINNRVKKKKFLVFYDKK